MNTNQLLHQELLGAIQLESAAQALDLAGRLLKAPNRLTSAQFAAVFDAVTLFAKDQKPWVSPLEQAFYRLAPRAQTANASALFDILLCNFDWPRAYKLMRRHGPFSQPSVLDIIHYWAQQTERPEIVAAIEPYLFEPRGRSGCTHAGFQSAMQQLSAAGLLPD